MLHVVVNQRSVLFRDNGQRLNTLEFIKADVSHPLLFSHAESVSGVILDTYLHILIFCRSRMPVGVNVCPLSPCFLCRAIKQRRRCASPLAPWQSPSLPSCRNVDDAESLAPILCHQHSISVLICRAGMPFRRQSSSDLPLYKVVLFYESSRTLTPWQPCLSFDTRECLLTACRWRMPTQCQSSPTSPPGPHPRSHPLPRKRQTRFPSRLPPHKSPHPPLKHSNPSPGASGPPPARFWRSLGLTPGRSKGAV